MVLFCLCCSVSSILAIPFWLSCSNCPALDCPFLVAHFFLFCPSYLILAVLCWQPHPFSPVMAALSWKSFHGSIFLIFLFWLSCSLSRSSCPVLTFLFFPSWPGCLILAVLPAPLSWQPLRAVLPWQCCPCSLPSGGPFLVALGCLALPVLLCLSLFNVPFWLSCSGCPVLVILFWQSCSGCPILAVLSGYPFFAIYTIRRTRANNKERGSTVWAQKTRSAGNATAQKQKREVQGPKNSAEAQARRAFARDSEHQKRAPSCG